MKYVIYLIVLAIIIALSIDGCNGTKWEFGKENTVTENSVEEKEVEGENGRSDENTKEEDTGNTYDFGELGLDTIAIDENWSEYIIYNGNKIYFGTPLSETPFENVPNNLAVNDDPRMPIDIVVKVPMDKYMLGALQTEDGLTSLEVCIMNTKNENNKVVYNEQFNGLYFRSVKGDMNIRAGNATTTIGLGNNKTEVTNLLGEGKQLDIFTDRRLTCWQKNGKCLHIGYGAESLKKGADQTNDYIFEIYITDIGSGYACKETN